VRQVQKNARRLRREALEHGTRAPTDPGFSGSIINMLNAKGEVGNPYEVHATVSRCVDVLVDACLDADPTLYTGTDEDKQPISEGPWYDLFLTPNPHLTRREFWGAFWAYRFLDGEVFLVMEGKGDEITDDEVPAELWPLPGRCFAEDVDPATGLITNWKCTTSTGVVDLAPERVLQFKRFDPNNPLRGLSEIQAAMPSLRADVKAQRYQEAFFDNGAMPSGALVYPREANPGKTQRDQAKKSFEDRHVGSGKQHRMMVLWGGMEWQQLGVNQRDMEFLVGRKFHRDEIAMVFGVHKVLLGDTDQVNRATSQEAKRILWENKILSLLKTCADVFEARLFRTRGDRMARARAKVAGGRAIWLEFDVSNVAALKDDLTQKLTALAQMMQQGVPYNQAVEKLDLGLEAQDWGDTSLLPFSLAPADQIVMGDPFADEAFEGGSVGSDEEGAEAVEAIHAHAKALLRSWTAQPIRARKTGRRTQKQREAYWRAVSRRVMNPGERILRRKFKRFFHARRKEVLRWLDGDRAIRTTSATELEAYLAKARKRWDEQLKALVNPVYRQIIDSAAEGVAEELGKPLAYFDSENPRVLEFLAQKEIKVVRIDKTLEKGIRKQLLLGMGDGETVTQLQERMRTLFNGAQSRSLTIARTESAQTTNGARDLAFEEAGVTATEWITSGDSHVRDAHVHLDGDVVERGQSFVPGITLRHPGDLQAPGSQTINCRCTAAPA